ncbi:MAG: putative manganese-dependent inorganic diphosphatase [Lachnospiraceae bacterium]|nr:putative manganese-dependent inorganic diphosphatase [Lachnospiraceae bacterium]
MRQNRDLAEKKELPEKPVFVIGHTNPDTDSICSAIAYATLKRKITGKRYIPKRAGQMNLETKYVLKRFNVDTPYYLNDVRRQVKDMEVNYFKPIRGCLSLKKAWERMEDSNVVTLPVCTEEGVLEGIITEGDIAESYMGMYSADVLSRAQTSYKNIVETLNGELLVGTKEDILDHGKILIAAANPDTLEDFIDEGDVIITGNRYETQLCAIEMKAGCVIVCTGSKVSKTIVMMAREHGCHIIETPYDTFTVARLINQSIPIDFFMKKEDLVTFQLNDFIDDVKETMTKYRHRDFPVVDKDNNFLGMISRRKLLGARKKRLILVDHNEISQAVDGLEDAEILEIIDHHRIGSLETVGPVYFRNQPLGCTATIITQMYRENGVEIDPTTAGLLCSAIISDTLMYRSPTCTPLDKSTCEELAQIAGINVEEHAKAMFRAGSDFGNRKDEEIFYQDFKKFVMGEKSVGIGQLSSMDDKELLEIRDRMFPYAQTVLQTDHLDIIYIMLTDILGEASYLLCVGDGADELAETAFGGTCEKETLYLPGVVSRKKQLVPTLMVTLQQEG